LYSVKVLNAAGSGTWSSVICGIDWVTKYAASYNIKVANMSLGGSGSDDGNCGNSNNDALHKAICGSTSKVTYAIAAGNSGADLASFVPAAYNEVLAVTAMTDSDGAPGGQLASNFCRSGESEETPASFSNFATSSSDQGHTIAAPGVCIYSTWTGGGYNTISGTSMASPHVAGTAVLYAASNPSATPAQVFTKLLADAAAKSGPGSNYGFTGDPNKYGYLAYAGGY
jgi:subtilisin family serine protease